MATPVKPPPRRGYRSELRAEQARQTRLAILTAARESFVAQGYAASTMRGIAAAAGVSVARVEQAFGTKAALLAAAIDVAIAGDDEPVAMHDRDWTAAALGAATVEQLLAITAAVLAAAQQRSAGLVLAAFEGTALDGDLSHLAGELAARRATTATWLVDRVRHHGALRPGLDRRRAIDSAWILMDPAIFDRLTRHRGWSTRRYQRWIADSIRHQLLPDPAPNQVPPPVAPRRKGLR